jgi:hypothetical protein
VSEVYKGCIILLEDFVALPGSYASPSRKNEDVLLQTHGGEDVRLLCRCRM